MNADTARVQSKEEGLRLVLAARGAGVRNQRVLEAMETVPRRRFVEALFENQALDNTALPIPCGQTISQPAIVAQMTEALDVGPRDKVLEVGTGSGYQAAILSRLARRVYSIERHPPLARTAQQRLRALGYNNVAIKIGDGARGWIEQAPFDSIIVTAAAEDLPRALYEQLRLNGVMVLPVGRTDATQTLLKVEKRPEGPSYTELALVRFVPLLEGVAKE